MRILAACFAALAIATSSTASAQQPNLNAVYTVKLGDQAAAALSEFLKLQPRLEDPAIVTYEPEPATIDVEVFGTPAPARRTDEARETLGRYWEFIQAAHIPYVERRFKTKLTAANYRLMYYDARADGGPKVILQFVNGQYVIP